jgi:hypothetical protein
MENLSFFMAGFARLGLVFCIVKGANNTTKLAVKQNHIRF